MRLWVVGEGTKAYYEGFKDYGTLYDTGIWRHYRKLASEILAGSLPARSGLRVLDLGGGAVLSLRELHADPRVAEYVVVDLVIKLPSGIPKVSTVQGDAVAYLRDYTGPPFDAIVIFGVLEYLDEAAVAELLKVLPARLAPQGRLLIHEPNSRAQRYMTQGQGKQRVIELEKLLPGTGLKLIQRRDYHVPLLRLALGKLGVKSPALLNAVLTVEPFLEGGADSLYLLSAA